MTGSLVQWFRDALGMIPTAAADRDAGRAPSPDNGGCYIVPGVLRAVRAALAPATRAA